MTTKRRQFLGSKLAATNARRRAREKEEARINLLGSAGIGQTLTEIENLGRKALINPIKKLLS